MGGSSSVNSSSSSPPAAAIETKPATNTVPAPIVTVVSPPAPVPTVAPVKINEPDAVTVVPSPAVAPVKINEPDVVTVVPSPAVAPRPPEESSGLGTLNIYYGTATGTAMGFARTLANEGKQKGFKACAIDLEDLDPTSLATSSSSLCIFVMATAGEGEPTDNAVQFNEWMSNTDQSISNDHLANLSFTVFGLGNKQYENYNQMGKRTNAIIESFGAKRVYPYGEGDDDPDGGTLESDFDQWKSELWPALIKSRQQ